jgi:hypothetical protein
MLVTDFSDNTMDRTQTFLGAFELKYGQNLSSRFCAFTSSFQRVQIKKNGRNFTKSSTKTEELPLNRSLAAEPLLWNMPVISKGEPEYVADLSEVRASAAH